MKSLRMLVGLAAIAWLGAAPASAQQPVKIRVSWVAPVSNWASIWEEKKDLAKHLGKSYTFEAVRYAGTPPMVTALASGELEIANLAYSTLGIAIKNAGLDDLRVIAHEFRDGAPGRYTHQYLALNDSAVKSVGDLKGKVVGTNAAGSAVDVAMRAILRKNGLEDKRDYTMLETPFPTMRAMLAQKKVDIIPGVLPFSLDPELRQDRASRVLAARGDRRDRDDHLGGAQAVHRQEPRGAGRLHGGFAAGSCAGSWTLPTRRPRLRSPPR